MITIHVIESAPREFRYIAHNKRRHYVQANLIGTVCETVAIRAVSGNANSKAPGDWPQGHDRHALQMLFQSLSPIVD